MSKRTFQKVSYAEIEPMLNLLKNTGMTEQEIATACGFSPGYFSTVRAEEIALKSCQMALRGLVAEKAPKNGSEFSLGFGETELLFDAVRRVRAASPGREKEFQKIQAKLALHMGLLAERV